MSKTSRADSEQVIAYKGFDKNLKCRGFQFEIGSTYAHEGKVIQCRAGFHACEYPLDVFGYYPPAESRYALVSLSGDLDRNDSGDTKIAAASIAVSAELHLPEIIEASVKWIMDRVSPAKGSNETGDRSAATNTGYQSAATNTGYQSAATNTGYRSAATNTGYQSAATNTGDRSAATNTGYRSAATNTGDQSAATNTGDQSAATNTGYQSAATNTGYQSAATNTGYQSAATNTGDRSAATNTGYQSAAEVSGEHSVAHADGYKSKAKASAGSAMTIVERNGDMEIIHIVAAIAGREGVKADTWYTLENGELVETDA